MPQPQYGQPGQYGQYGQPSQYGQPGQYGQYGSQAPYGQQPQYGQQSAQAQPGYGHAPAGGGPYPGSDQGAGPRPSVTFRQALRNRWSYKFLFTGRASVSEYWWVQLAMFIGMLVVEGLLAVVGGVVVAASGDKETGVTLAVALLYLVVTVLALLVVVMTLALTVRRLHDANFSGLWYLAVLFPFLGPIAVLVMTLMPSNPLGRRFDTPQDQYRP